MKKLSDSLKLDDSSDERTRKCHKLFQRTMYHNTDSGIHNDEMFREQCVTCNEIIKKKTQNNDILYLANVFNGYSRKTRDHISLKTLDVNIHEESVYFYNSIFEHLGINPLTYFKHVLENNLKNDENKEGIMNALSKSLDGFERYSAQGLLIYTWANAIWKKNIDDKKLVKPVFGIYTTFGDRMSKFLEIPNDAKYFIHSDDLDESSQRKHWIHLDRHNILLTPRFIYPKIQSYFIYTDVVKQSIRLGDTLSNLLAIITVDDSIVNIKNPINTFKPISHNSINNIAVIISDQSGEQLHFTDKQYAAVEMIIKRRED